MRTRTRNETFVADFESTTDPIDCRVWAWGSADLFMAKDNSGVDYGNDLESYIEFISSMSSTTYFHNLKFDGVFIIDWLLNNGYTHSMERKLNKGEFSTLISSMGSYYSINVHWITGNRTEFRDSHKKLPFSAAHIAKAFNVPMLKGEIDYHAHRPIGHKITREEWEYLCNDVLIIVHALRSQLEEGMVKMTVGSDALAEFKALTGSRKFDKLFPVLPLSMDSEIRLAYRGGFTYADKRTQGRRTGPGRVYDVNSLYPSVMRHAVLPYDFPVFVEGYGQPTDAYPLVIQSLTFTARLKKNHIPCIQVKGSSHFVNTEYQTHIKEPVTMMASNVDIDLWEDHYDLDILSYNGAWCFKGLTGFFDGYIDKWMKVKIEATGALRELAKLMLNSLYGKFATNPDITGKYPVLENGVVKLVLGEEELREPIYTAMGVFITAYARDITIRAAQKHYKGFAYADTDSLHILLDKDEDPDTLEIAPHKLGAWKYEYSFESGVFLRAKQYSERLTEESRLKLCPKVCDPEKPHECSHVTHIAGMPVKVAATLTLDDMKAGAVFGGALRATNVPGGVVLIDREFTLKL